MNRFTPIVRAREKRKSSGKARRYWAFLSYAHADERAASKMHLWLERYRVPKTLVGKTHPLGRIPARLSPVFRDRQELAASSDLSREIIEALEVSRYFVVLCSPAAARSRWVDKEIRDFKRIHGDDRILAAILEGEPFSSDPDRECFPPALRCKVGADGNLTDVKAEPIAADLRDKGDGWRGGFLKLVAGMLDVGLDDLVRRDQQRRQKRMAWMAAASLAGMTVTSGLALYALDQRNAARDERREAEGLVEFMLGDLKGKLEPIGKLDALDGVGSKILAYYSKQDTTELDDAGLRQRSRALSLTAQVAYQRGDMTGAMQLYRQAMAGTGEAVARNPYDAQRLYDHAQNVFWIGEIARYSGHQSQAEAAYRKYQQLGDAMVALEPTNLTYRLEPVYARQLIGIVLLNKREFDEATALFESALGPIRAMALANPANDQFQGEYGTMLAWVADAKQNQGDLASATKFRRMQIENLNSRLEAGSTDVKLQEFLIPARQALGILLAMQGQHARAIEELRQAVARSERLIPVEPENAVWKNYAARARLELASTLADVDRYREAESEALSGCAILEQLVAAGSREPLLAGDLTNCHTVRARIALSRGQSEEAITLASQAIRSARSERSADPLRPHFRAAFARRLIGDARRQAGDLQGAREAWLEAYRQMPRNIAERPREIAERMALLERLGKRAEARALANRLKKIGWQD